MQREGFPDLLFNFLWDGSALLDKSEKIGRSHTHTHLQWCSHNLPFKVLPRITEKPYNTKYLRIGSFQLNAHPNVHRRWWESQNRYLQINKSHDVGPDQIDGGAVFAVVKNMCTSLADVRTMAFAHSRCVYIRRIAIGAAEIQTLK